MQTKLVFVPNKNPRHDYTKAWDFGDLVFCTQAEINRQDLLTMKDEVEQAMIEAGPDDYILVASLSSLCGIMCGLFASRFGCLNLLLFDRGEYTSQHLSFKEP
jgi:hypothetical protein